MRWPVISVTGRQASLVLDYMLRRAGNLQQGLARMRYAISEKHEQISTAVRKNTTIRQVDL